MSTQVIPIPEPKIYPVVMHYPYMDLKNPVQRLIQLAQEYGPTYRLRFPDRNVVFTGEHSVVNDLCDESRFEKSIHRTLEHLRDLGGDGLFTAETKDPAWQKGNRILVSAFGPAALRGMFEPMMDIADQMLTKWERFGDKAVISVSDDMTRLTLDTIAVCGFNYRFNSFYSKEMHPFVDAMVRGLQEAGARTGRIPLATTLMKGTQKKYDDDIRFMRDIAQGLIDERKIDPDAKSKNDLLNRMLSGVDPVSGEGLTDSNIGYQMITFLIAGHETTSGLLSFTLYFLLKNPEIMERARREVDSVLGGHAPGFADISKLEYLDQILKESLRVWPTAPAFGVRPIHGDEVVGGKYEIKKGEDVMVMLPVLHRDTEVWGDHPDRFDPDHFSAANVAKMPPHAWKPFGNGTRGCIGRQFAMQEATLVLAMLLQRFEIELEDPNYVLKLKESLTLKPDGLKIRARLRKTYGRNRRNTDAPLAAGTTGQRTGSATALQTVLRFFYGSNTGTSESFARRLAQEAQHIGYLTTVETLDSAVGNLKSGDTCILLCASYNGKPPHNARKFVNWIQELSGAALKGVSFTVFGCGNRDWASTFQSIPNFIDEQMEKLGAERLLEKGSGDAKQDILAEFEKWHALFWQTIPAKRSLLPNVSASR